MSGDTFGQLCVTTHTACVRCCEPSSPSRLFCNRTGLEQSIGYFIVTVEFSFIHCTSTQESPAAPTGNGMITYRTREFLIFEPIHLWTSAWPSTNEKPQAPL